MILSDGREVWILMIDNFLTRNIVSLGMELWYGMVTMYKSNSMVIPSVQVDIYGAAH